VHFLSTTFADRAPHPETVLPRPRKPLYPKKHKVSRPRVFSPVTSHASELSHFPTTCWWVVDMMMWSTWWDMNMMTRLPPDIVRNSEVFELNFLWYMHLSGGFKHLFVFSVDYRWISKFYRGFPMIFQLAMFDCHILIFIILLYPHYIQILFGLYSHILMVIEGELPSSFSC
jgi:hypothetical protein